MEKEVYEVIKKVRMFNAGDVVGVAVSGGADSMALLHFLFENKDNLDISVMAITVDHMLRGEKSMGDALFVRTWCKEHGVPCLVFTVDAGRIASERNIGVEDGARQARYEVFERLLKENKVDKIALAHHKGDQAETILMHILRGAGLSGAGGMDYVRNNYVRPFLDISKDDIVRYCGANFVEYVEDETNSDITYNRNYLRNIVIPELKKRWEGAENNIVQFGKCCKEDNEYILSHTSHDGIIIMNDTAKIPLIYFHYAKSVSSRIVFDALSKINVTKDIERKHIDMIFDLVEGENGKKINLPNGLVAQKEYDYITLYKTQKKIISEVFPIKTGKTDFAGIYEISVKRTNKLEPRENTLMIDAKKVPENSVWRVRKAGDSFTKFGGGTKTLKNYLIDKKIPLRVRETLPVLASGNEILCILGVEISDKVKLDKDTKFAYIISGKPILKK
jgi:tRNA(Ile)-lysidine synthase